MTTLEKNKLRVIETDAVKGRTSAMRVLNRVEAHVRAGEVIAVHVVAVYRNQNTVRLFSSRDEDVLRTVGQIEQLKHWLLDER